LRPAWHRVSWWCRAPCQRTSIHPSSKMLCWKAHIASVYFKCFICMLQVFHVDVAKVGRDVAYVAMAIHVCYKRLF
jgi:hypothetical protein